MKKLAARGPRQFAHRVAHRFKLHAVEGRKVVLILEQEIHIALVHAIIDGGLNMKDVEFSIDNLAEPDAFISQLGARRIHVAVRVANRLRLMMRAQRLVITKSDRDGFVAAIHRHKVDIAVNEEIAFGATTV